MTKSAKDAAIVETEILEGIDVDHLTDEFDHVAIELYPDGDLQAVPFRKTKEGYDELDVDLIQFDEVCEHVQEQTDYDRPINFARVPAWPPEGPTATGPDTTGPGWPFQ